MMMMMMKMINRHPWGA